MFDFKHFIVFGGIHFVAAFSLWHSCFGDKLMLNFWRNFGGQNFGGV
jgi:hypothetical protein